MNLKKEYDEYYVLTLTDTDGNEHEVKVDSLPATLVDKDGNEYIVIKNETDGTDEVKISEVVTSESAITDKTVRFKIENNYYVHNRVYTSMFMNKNVRIELHPADETTTIDWADVEVFLKKKGSGGGTSSISIRKDSVQNNNAYVVTRFIEISISKTSLNTGNELIMKTKSNNKEIGKLKIEMYYSPYVKFDLGNGYNQSYFFDKGFDDHSSLKSTKYYNTITVGKNNETYYVPVLGVTVGEEATIKVDLKDFDSKIANDTTFRIVLKAKTNSLLQLNGQNDSLIVNRTELENIKNNGLIIRSLRSVNGQKLTPIFIDVMIRSNREIVGQLEYYSATPVNKHVQLVYVKFANESNHPNYITPAVLQSYLNSQSMNQLFIEFTVDSIQANSTLKTAFFEGITSSNRIIGILHGTIFNGQTPSIYDKLTADYYFVTNLNISLGEGKYQGGAHFVGDLGGYSVKNNSSARETDEELITHELGHWIGLPHTFDSNGNVSLIINSTQGGTINKGDNFMDYNLRRKRWFKIQLLNFNRFDVK